ncbi:MAG: invasion associated locus B family protein [Rhizobiaceae bacterium]|nr:invasion associated locus B family protein [Rhizobiaceae bacterium]
MKNTVSKFISAIAIALAFSIFVMASSASAQTPNRIKQFKAWGAYSHQSAAGKICYILSIPVKKEPGDRDHGDVFFMLSQHPGQNGALEPQFTVGYPFQESSKVTLNIDGKTFTMFTRGSNAWMENRAEESQVIAAMRAGKDMVVSGFSRRGTNTKYTYSLAGVTASLKEIQNCAGS